MGKDSCGERGRSGRYTSGREGGSADEGMRLSEGFEMMKSV